MDPPSNTKLYKSLNENTNMLVFDRQQLFDIKTVFINTNTFNHTLIVRK